MNKRSSNLDELAQLIYDEKRNEFQMLLKSLRNSIDNNKMPLAKPLLKKMIEQSAKRSPKSDKKDKINRPPNSNIIYTNQLNVFGLLDIIRAYCDREKINKQSLVPISKKLSKILWEELSEIYRKFFDKLAAEVSIEHKKLFPNYKYTPKRKSKVGTYKHYDPNVPKVNTTDCKAPVQIPTPQASQEDASIEIDQIDFYSQSSILMLCETPSSSLQTISTGNDDLPTFSELPPSSPLQPNYFDYVAAEEEHVEPEQFPFIPPPLSYNNYSETYDVISYDPNLFQPLRQLN